jgi:Domain of unknown function (DUF4159)
MLTANRVITKSQLRRLGGGLLAVTLGLSGFQMPFRQYASLEPYDDVALPPDWQDHAEWVFARLMYPQHPNAKFARWGWRGGTPEWRQGGTSWSQDYPRADRHFAQAMRRLTRVQARSVEQPVNLEDGDDVYNWPWLCAGEMGDWKLTPEMAAKLREFLLRGGFLLLDDFWGKDEWGRFEESMKLVFPDRPIVEIENDDQIFHTMYDLDERFQIPGQWALRRRDGRLNRGEGDETPHWMGIYDDHKRIMVAMYYNSDVGDSWEWADDPGFPERYSALGVRLGVNYTIYAMTH